MREQLNSNPLAQVAVVGVLLVAVGFFVMSTMGGGGEEEAEADDDQLGDGDGAGRLGATPRPVDRRR